MVACVLTFQDKGVNHSKHLPAAGSASIVTSPSSDATRLTIIPGP